MKNFDAEFRKAVNEMKPDKSAVRRAVLNGEKSDVIRPAKSGFGMKFGSLLTAGLSLVLVFGIIVGGGILNGMKKPSAPLDTSHGSVYSADNVSDTAGNMSDTIGNDTETVSPVSDAEYTDTSWSEGSDGETSVTTDPVTDPVTDVADDTETQPAEPPDTPDTTAPIIPDVEFSYDPIDDFGVDALSEVSISSDGLDLKIINNELSRWRNFNSFDAVYTVGGVEKSGRMFVALSDPLEFDGTDIYVPSIYLVLYDPESRTVVAAKKWYMAGAVFVNSDIPGAFLLFGASYDTSDIVNGYFGVYRVTDSVTGKPDFVLDHGYDSCKIQRTFFKKSLTADKLVTFATDEKYNNNYYQRLRKLVADERFGQILDIYGGYSCMAGECFSDPKYRRDLSDAEFEVFSDITQLAEYNGK